MLHARKDYNERIQDNANLIPKDEPVFLLRAQDVNALATLQDYYGYVGHAKNSDPAIMEGVKRQIGRFINWRKRHTDFVKEPDMSMDDVV